MDKARTIETMEHWEKACIWFKENGYSPWQQQYSWNLLEGMHAWFMKSGDPDIEIVTHSQAVHDAILKFNAQK